MTLEDYSGDWKGSYDGAASGSLTLLVIPTPDAFVIEASLEDNAEIIEHLIGTGTITDNQLIAKLSPRNFTNAQQNSTGLSLFMLCGISMVVWLVAGKPQMVQKAVLLLHGRHRLFKCLSNLNK